MPLISSSIAAIFAAQVATAQDVSEEASKCHMRDAPLGEKVPYEDYNLEMFSIHLGCLLTKQDHGRVSKEDVRTTVLETQDYIRQRAALNLRDDYTNPDGIIGPNFAHDYSQVAYIEGFAAPYFVQDGTVYGEGTTIELNIERLARELSEANPQIFNDMKRALSF